MFVSALLIISVDPIKSRLVLLNSDVQCGWSFFRFCCSLFHTTLYSTRRKFFHNVVGLAVQAVRPQWYFSPGIEHFLGLSVTSPKFVWEKCPFTAQQIEPRYFLHRIYKGFYSSTLSRTKKIYNLRLRVIKTYINRYVDVHKTTTGRSVLWANNREWLIGFCR